jgi:hypothetical protein
MRSVVCWCNEEKEKIYKNKNDQYQYEEEAAAEDKITKLKQNVRRLQD